jgi:ATP-dependent DNA ligase
MKGNPYHPLGKLMKAKTLDELKLRGKPGVLQVKLDGWRIRVKVNADEVVFYSSGGDILPTFEHIEKVIRKGYDKFVRSYGLQEFFLDGEMYLHNIAGGFNTIASACGTRVHITPEKKALREQLEFHLLDIISDKPYAMRYSMLYPFIDGPVVLVNNTMIESLNDEIIQQHFEQFLAEGYEGLMIRTLDSPYEFKRTKQLTKFKPFIDEEFQVVGFKKSITGETLGSFECKMEDGTLIYPNPMGDVGTDAAKLEIWNNKEKHIGKWLNCRFMEYTEDGVPRHPRGMHFRKGKSKD